MASVTEHGSKQQVLIYFRWYECVCVFVVEYGKVLRGLRVCCIVFSEDVHRVIFV